MEGERRPVRVAIGSDHAGFEMKEMIKAQLTDRGLEVSDFGTSSCESVDYPDIALPVSIEVSRGNVELGILVCGTGIGMSIAANKVKGIRAALCHDVFSARVTREHNDSNVLCLGARVIGQGHALEIVNAWLGSSFVGGHHEARIQKITEIEKG